MKVFCVIKKYKNDDSDAWQVGIENLSRNNLMYFFICFDKRKDFLAAKLNCSKNPLKH